MTILGKWSVASFALVSSLFVGAGAFAGDDCCKGGEKAAAEPAGCCGGEKVADAKKPEQCDLGACDAKHAAQLDGILAKLNAPVPALSADDAKAVAAAKQTLMQCPAGRAFTSVTPTILEAVNALRAMDEAVAKTNGLPENCRTKEGNCAFCAEVGKDMPEQAMAAMKISMASIARAQKLAQALAPIAASFPLKGETTKPAGFALDEAGFATLAKKVDAASKEVASGLEAACKMPEAEGKKLEAAFGAAIATLDKLAPMYSPTTLAPAHMALYRELGLANDAVQAFAKAFPKTNDPKFVEGLSANARNAHKLFTGRAQLIASLGGLHAAAKPGECEETSAKPTSGEAGCCGAEGQKKDAPAKPSN